MTDLIDFFGTPLRLSTVQDFRIVTVEYIYQASYRTYTLIEQKGVLRKTAETKRFTEFNQMEPYGVIVGKYQTFDLSDYYPKPQSTGAAIGQGAAKRGFRIWDIVHEKIIDKAHINQVESRPLLIRRHSGATEQSSLRDIPIKLYFDRGQTADVPKNSEYLQGIAEPLTSSVIETPALIVKADPCIVIYGNGIDVDDVQKPYKFLFNCMQRLEEEKTEKLSEKNKKEKKKLTINVPKLQLPEIHFQSPIKLGKDAKAEPAQEEQKSDQNG